MDHGLYRTLLYANAEDAGHASNLTPKPCPLMSNSAAAAVQIVDFLNDALLLANAEAAAHASKPTSSPCRLMSTAAVAAAAAAAADG
jgi:hypothetical protein